MSNLYMWGLIVRCVLPFCEQRLRLALSVSFPYIRLACTTDRHLHCRRYCSHCQLDSTGG